MKSIQLYATLVATLLTAGSLLAGESTDLIVDDLSAWRGDTGDWVLVGSTKLDPADSQRLASRGGEGVALNGPTGRTTHLVSKAEHGDVQLHVEFMVPQNSNSGVYLQGRYEIQVYDSWGIQEPSYLDAGGIYQRWRTVEIDGKKTGQGYEGIPPRVNAAYPPGAWQTFDITFHAPRFDAAGNKTANALFVKVVHNGIVIHENQEVTGPTRAAMFSDEKPTGPLMFQGDHGPVAYRNVRIESK